MKRDGKATRAVCIALLASGFLSKREAQAFPLAPSAGDVPPAPSPKPGIPQARAIENLCLHYRTHEPAAHISSGQMTGMEPLWLSLLLLLLGHLPEDSAVSGELSRPVCTLYELFLLAFFAELLPPARCAMIWSLMPS